MLTILSVALASDSLPSWQAVAWVQCARLAILIWNATLGTDSFAFHACRQM